MNSKNFLIIALLLAFRCYAIGQDVFPKDIVVAAEQMDRYLPIIKDGNIALCVNHTSMVGSTHLLDTLLSKGMKIKKIFCPEHGFRGEAEAGKQVQNDIDAKTGIPIVSLYGSNKKPTAEQMQDIDIVIFDIQDVGARFYTYISTLSYIMEAAAENNVTVLVFDRPNPNGYWVDGPVLDTAYSSFVGLHPVPINHGMTVAEYARMVNGEGWLKGGVRCRLLWVKIQGYNHKQRYQIPIKPSPNLPTMESVYLYPTLCLFEGTPMSIGRGTDKPFEILGYPTFLQGNFFFTPKNISGAATNPPCLGKKCRGVDLSKKAISDYKPNNRIDIKLVIDTYNHFPDKEKFFQPFFNKLIGNNLVAKQIKDGLSAEQIRESWQKDLAKFKQKRKKYLLYEDF